MNKTWIKNAHCNFCGDKDGDTCPGMTFECHHDNLLASYKEHLITQLEKEKEHYLDNYWDDSVVKSASADGAIKALDKAIQLIKEGGNLHPPLPEEDNQ